MLSSPLTRLSLSVEVANMIQIVTQRCEQLAETYIEVTGVLDEGALSTLVDCLQPVAREQKARKAGDSSSSTGRSESL